MLSRIAHQNAVEPPAVGQRVAAWLRQTYPAGVRCKQIARDFNVSSPTVDRWLAGYRPIGGAFDQMVVRWGRAFLAWVYQPLGWAEAERLQCEIDAAHGQLARIEADLRKLGERS